MQLLGFATEDSETRRRMATKQCCACGRQLDDCRERRKLHSASTSHVLPVLLKSISSQLSLDESLVLQLLPESSLICRSPCFSSLATLIKLELQMKRVKEEIASRLLQSGLYASTSNPEAPSAKRRRIESGSTPSRSKQLLFTVDTHDTSPQAMVRS